MARVRIQRLAGRSGAPAAAGGAVSHAPRLADVVRVDGSGSAERLVFQSACRPAARRCADRWTAADESISECAAALHPRGVLPLQVHGAGRASANRAVVEPYTRWHVL